MTVTRRAPAAQERAMEIVYASDPVVVVPGTTETVVVDDVQVVRSSDETTDSRYRCSLSVPLPSKRYAEWSVDDEDIAVVDQTGTVTRVSDGTVRVTAKHPWETLTQLLAMSRDEGQTVDAFDSWVEGSLGAEVEGVVEALVDGEDPNNNRSLFTGSYGTGMTRTAACPFQSLDFTGCSPWNSYSGNKKAGTLIAADVIVHARHFPGGLPDGTEVYFWPATGEPIMRTVVGSVDIADTDIRLSRLNADVPTESIAVYPLLPSDWEDYIPGLSWGVYALGLDQYERVQVDVWRYVTQSGTTGAWKAGFSENPTNPYPVYDDWHIEPVGGDSGNPVFLPLDGQLVLLSTWTSPDQGPALWKHIDEIDAALASLGLEHTVTTMDLSGYAD